MLLRKKLAILVAMAMMLAMMLASAGMASAAPASGQGGAKANPNATFGIITAVSHSDDCNICG